MMTGTLWTFLIMQIAMGLFDTVVHHEGTERLAWRPGSRRELQLHGVRNLLYAVMFVALGWWQPGGGWAFAFAALLVTELVITLWDFVEEDRSRRLPASERITHTLLTLNYGVILALLAPLIAVWAAEPTGLTRVDYGWISWLCAMAALGVVVSGTRDLFAAGRAQRLRPGPARALADGLATHQHILITGGTGFVGSRLVEALVEAGHAVTVLTRDRASAAALLAPVTIVTDLAQIDSAAQIDAVINLAGEPISNGLWTAAKRARIIASRIDVTRACADLIARLERKPAVLVSGSAIGWYGLRGAERLDECGDSRDCFSHEICREWEGATEGVGIRTVLLRIGLVLDNSGGFLARMLTPFEFGLGGPFGNGNHWMSWIHRDDLVRLMVHAIATPALTGPLNATAPEPVTNRDFTRALGAALRRPAIIPVPRWPLHLLLGQFADELLFSGQRVVPAAALASGFRFTYPQIGSAFAAIVGRKA